MTQQPGMGRCPRCGSPVIPHSDACPACGLTKAEVIALAAAASQPPIAAPATALLPATPPPPAAPVVEPTPARVAPVLPPTVVPRQFTGLPVSVIAELERITGDSLADGDIRLTADPDDAKAEIARLKLMQKELRVFNRNVRHEMSLIRQAHVTNRQGVQAGFVATIFGKQAAAQDRIAKRERSKLEQAQDLAPYQSLIDLVDRTIIGIDGIVLQLQRSR